eukprot:g31225.t2
MARTCWARAAAVQRLFRRSAATQHSPLEQQVLAGLPNICQSPAMENAWQQVQPLLSSKDTSSLVDGLSLLVAAALASDDLPRARRICLRCLDKQLGPSKKTVDLLPASVLHALICAHARLGDADAAFAFLGSLETPGAPIPVEIFESLIEGLVSRGRARSAFGAFERMRSWALLEPTVKLYVQMIKACSLVRDPDRAEALIEEMKNKYEEAHSEFIIALASRRRTASRAFQLASESSRRGLAPSARLCVALARACAETSNAEEAKQLRRRMRAAQVEPDVGLRADLVRAFGQAAALVQEPGLRGRLLANAWRELQESRQQGPIPLEPRLGDPEMEQWIGGAAQELLHAMLAAYCSCGAPTQAEEILLMSREELGVEPDETAYHLVLSALATSHAGRFRELWRRLQRQTPLRPTAKMLPVALKVALVLQEPRRGALRSTTPHAHPAESACCFGAMGGSRSRPSRPVELEESPTSRSFTRQVPFNDEEPASPSSPPWTPLGPVSPGTGSLSLGGRQFFGRTAGTLKSPASQSSKSSRPFLARSWSALSLGGKKDEPQELTEFLRQVPLLKCLPRAAGMKEADWVGG